MKKSQFSEEKIVSILLTVLEGVMRQHGTPEHVRSDTAPSSWRMRSRTGW